MALLPKLMGQKSFAKCRLHSVVDPQHPVQGSPTLVPLPHRLSSVHTKIRTTTRTKTKTPHSSYTLHAPWFSWDEEQNPSLECKVSHTNRQPLRDGVECSFGRLDHTRSAHACEQNFHFRIHCAAFTTVTSQTTGSRMSAPRKKKIRTPQFTYGCGSSVVCHCAYAEFICLGGLDSKCCSCTASESHLAASDGSVLDEDGTSEPLPGRGISDTSSSAGVDASSFGLSCINDITWRSPAVHIVYKLVCFIFFQSGVKSWTKTRTDPPWFQLSRQPTRFCGVPGRGAGALPDWISFPSFSCFCLLNFYAGQFVWQGVVSGQHLFEASLQHTRRLPETVAIHPRAGNSLHVNIRLVVRVDKWTHNGRTKFWRSYNVFSEPPTLGSPSYTHRCLGSEEKTWSLEHSFAGTQAAPVHLRVGDWNNKFTSFLFVPRGSSLGSVSAGEFAVSTGVSSSFPSSAADVAVTCIPSSGGLSPLSALDT